MGSAEAGKCEGASLPASHFPFPRPTSHLATQPSRSDSPTSDFKHQTSDFRRHSTANFPQPPHVNSLMLDALVQDARYALRWLLRSPGFATSPSCPSASGSGAIRRFLRSSTHCSSGRCRCANHRGWSTSTRAARTAIPTRPIPCPTFSITGSRRTSSRMSPPIHRCLPASAAAIARDWSWARS